MLHVCCVCTSTGFDMHRPDRRGEEGWDNDRRWPAFSVLHLHSGFSVFKSYSKSYMYVYYNQPGMIASHDIMSKLCPLFLLVKNRWNMQSRSGDNITWGIQISIMAITTMAYPNFSDEYLHPPLPPHPHNTLSHLSAYISGVIFELKKCLSTILENIHLCSQN